MSCLRNLTIDSNSIFIPTIISLVVVMWSSEREPQHGKPIKKLLTVPIFLLSCTLLCYAIDIFFNDFPDVHIILVPTGTLLNVINTAFLLPLCFCPPFQAFVSRWQFFMKRKGTTKWQQELEQMALYAGERLQSGSLGELEYVAKKLCGYYRKLAKKLANQKEQTKNSYAHHKKLFSCAFAVARPLIKPLYNLRKIEALYQIEESFSRAYTPISGENGHAMMLKCAMKNSFLCVLLEALRSGQIDDSTLIERYMRFSYGQEREMQVVCLVVYLLVINKTGISKENVQRLVFDIEDEYICVGIEAQNWMAILYELLSQTSIGERYTNLFGPTCPGDQFPPDAIYNSGKIMLREIGSRWMSVK